MKGLHLCRPDRRLANAVKLVIPVVLTATFFAAMFCATVATIVMFEAEY
jgi:hypothetical protein